MNFNQKKRVVYSSILLLQIKMVAWAPLRKKKPDCSKLLRTMWDVMKQSWMTHIIRKSASVCSLVHKCSWCENVSWAWAIVGLCCFLAVLIPDFFSQYCYLPCRSQTMFPWYCHVLISWWRLSLGTYLPSSVASSSRLLNFGTVEVPGLIILVGVVLCIHGLHFLPTKSKNISRSLPTLLITCVLSQGQGGCSKVSNVSRYD